MLTMFYALSGSLGWQSTQSPFVGDRSYDPVQHLISCETRLHTNAANLVERIAGLTEVDPERLRLWTFARAAADPREDWTNTQWIDIAKALSP